MLSTVYYLVRSKVDGKYLAANPKPDSTERYILIFRENFDALGYLNKYAGELKEKLAVESITLTQLKGVMQRWGYTGVGLVEDPLLPKVEFLSQVKFGNLL
jgi:hypothetical protein